MRILNEPQFTFVRDDLTGMGFWQRLRHVWQAVPNLELLADYQVELDDGTVVVARQKMITDLASVPRLFWVVPGHSPSGPMRYGALLHDPGYQFGYWLTPKKEGVVYPDKSLALYDMFPERFGDYMPVFVGESQKFFDAKMRDIVICATDAKIVANDAYAALRAGGWVAWRNYRTKGPTAYGVNSLGLPGLLANGGVKF